MVRGTIIEEKFTYKDFKKQLQFNQIEDYLVDDSKLEWVGENFRILCKRNTISLEPVSKAATDIPKIMYIPAERNFLSSFSFSHIKLLPRLSLSLATFLEEYNNAKRNIKGEMQMPLSGVVCEYDRLNDVLWIKRELNHTVNKTRLENVASGFQSVTPFSCC